MKKNLILTFAMAIMTLATFAQETPAPARGEKHPNASPQERAKQATDKLNGVVKLSTDQYTKVLEANTNFFTQRAALRGAGGPPSDETKTKMKALMDDREAKVKAILSADQWKKKEEARKAQVNDRGAFKPGEE
ncbi:MAG: hypothetical protein JWO06_133 [Bacteroidota bacterium]|nr:hypothetical protein [Bacteroidota bacterium]